MSKTVKALRVFLSRLKNKIALEWHRRGKAEERDSRNEDAADYEVLYDSGHSVIRPKKPRKDK